MYPSHRDAVVSRHFSMITFSFDVCCGFGCDHGQIHFHIVYMNCSVMELLSVLCVFSSCTLVTKERIVEAGAIKPLAAAVDLASLREVNDHGTEETQCRHYESHESDTTQMRTPLYQRKQCFVAFADYDM